MDEIFQCDHSKSVKVIESLPSCGTVHYDVQGASNFHARWSFDEIIEGTTIKLN